MAVGRFLNDGAIPTLTLAGIAKASDKFLVHDFSAVSAAQVTASEIMDRLLSSDSITWMTALANMAAIDATNDRFVVWDASATAWKVLAATEILDRILTTADITALAGMASIGSVDGAADRLLLWDASANSFVALTAGEVTTRLTGLAVVNYTSTPVTITTAMSGQVSTNYGAGLLINFNLPAAVAGMHYSFVRHAAYAIRLNPNGSEPIGDATGGKYLELQSSGRVDMRSYVTGTWIVDGASALFGMQP